MFFFTISKGFVSSEAEFLAVIFFCVCLQLIYAQNRNLGLTPSSDLKIERFKSLNWFFTISKGFVSSEAEFLAVIFFCVCLQLIYAQNRNFDVILSRTSELSDLKA